MSYLRLAAAAVLLLVACPCIRPISADEAPKLFAKENLVAWCIVPFDSAKRGPAERAAMLKQLGFRKFAYDWRAEHVPTFDAEIVSLKKHGIELTAWWFPASLNEDAKKILAALKRHDVKTQLWITMNDPAPGKDQAAKVEAAVRQLRPIVDAASAQGCSVGLYNHGGWFGEPENQIEIIKALKADSVGIVYNQHHGHVHVERFADLLETMKPYLYVLNLNGMDRDGDKLGRKILPLGAGELDRELLAIVAKSGYQGPIGILGHTPDDAQVRLEDNLAGLDWLTKAFAGDDPGPPPTPRTRVPDRIEKGAEAADRAHAIAQEAIQRGDALRGLEVFRSVKFACLSCHKVGEHGGNVGPALTTLGKTQTPRQLAESVLHPKKIVKPEFVAWQIVTDDGRSRQGYKRSETATDFELFDIAAQQSVKIAKAEIEDQREVGTLMPDNLASAMSDAELRDLVRFLSELGNTPGLAERLAHANSHVAANFPYGRAPLKPEFAPSWQAAVNRDRVYDFYTKEANYFRSQHPRPALLAAFPGLDGGKQGHWGNQHEQVWRDDRWSRADLGHLLCGVLHLPSGPVAKAVCIRLGEGGELSACFNPATLRYEAVWRGGFVKLSPVRYGFIDGLRPDGELVAPPADPPASQPFVYRGFYRAGKRIVFAYRLGEVEMLDAPWVERGRFTRVVAPASEHPLRDIVINGGASQWPEPITVEGRLGSTRPYAIDTIGLPTNNPWKMPVSPGGHGFLSSGDALVCTMQGDVWRASGLDGSLKQVTWKRVASGLHQALGMVVHDDEPFVLGRDQITRLHDLNEDGEYDFYECFSNAMLTSPSGHDYTCGLERDPEGRFYTASGKQGVIRISADGKHVEVLATGFRNPDGIGLAADGAVTVPCSEGDWTPASMICLVKPKASKSNVPPFFGFGGPQNGQPPALPLVYLPRGLDNSSGGQVSVPDKRWGPLEGQLLHFSLGAGRHFLLLRDEVQGQPQGAIVPLGGEFRSGAHRGAFNSKDGQLYVSGMSGWGSYVTDDGSFERVRYVGDRVQLPLAWRAHQNGVWVRFSELVDAKKLGDLEQQFAQAWNYRYSQGYGSPELSARQRNVVGHDHLHMTGLHAVGSHEVFAEIPDLQPVNVLHLSLKVDSGEPQDLFATVHQLAQPFTKFETYEPTDKTIAPHPQLLDLASLKNGQQNPWRQKIAKPRTIRVLAGKNLTFEPRNLEARPGEPIRLIFENPDVVPHNWVLIKPGKLATIGELTNQLVADPEAVLRHYVPKSDDVLAYTDIVGPEQSFTIFFHAPQQPGRYPFLCTFPGHWMVMNGEFVIKPSHNR